jgi:hypothetical protein
MGSEENDHEIGTAGPRILGDVKTEVRNKIVAGRVNDISSPEALSRFRKAAKAFTTKTTKSRAAAIETLISEGIYTRSGRLSKNYR